MSKILKETVKHNRKRILQLRRGPVSLLMTGNRFSKSIQFEIPRSLPMQSERRPGNAKKWEASAMNARKDGGACLRHGASRHTNFTDHEKGMKFEGRV